jgi:uncharacterized BrkB/YihY/UPF0761 family membrane protein
MADIDVERAGSSVWPWVIGVVALVLLAAALWSLLSTDGTVRVRQATPGAVPTGQ